MSSTRSACKINIHVQSCDFITLYLIYYNREISGLNRGNLTRGLGTTFGTSTQSSEMLINHLSVNLHVVGTYLRVVKPLQRRTFLPRITLYLLTLHSSIEPWLVVLLFYCAFVYMTSCTSTVNYTLEELNLKFHPKKLGWKPKRNIPFLLLDGCVWLTKSRLTLEVTKLKWFYVQASQPEYSNSFMNFMPICLEYYANLC